MTQVSVPSTRRAHAPQLVTVIVAALTAAVVSVALLVVLEPETAPAVPAGEVAPAQGAGTGDWTEGRLESEAWQDYPLRLGG